MTEVQSILGRSRAVSWLFAAGLVAIPFDAVRGLNALGELGNELSFPFFAAAIMLALAGSVAGGDNAIGRSLALRVGIAIVAVILVSYLANLTAINAAIFRERSGLNKFATSMLVIFYGIGLAWLSEQVDAEQSVQKLARFVGWSAGVATAYLLFEFAGKHGLLGGVFDQIDSIVHTRQADIINAWNGTVNEKVLYGWDPRLRSVSFEPPAFGNFTGFAWPWVWYAAVRAAPQRRLRSWALFIAFTFAIVAAASRTGLLMLVCNLGTLGLLMSIYARGRANSEAAAALRLLVPAAAVLLLAMVGIFTVGSYQNIVAGLMQGDSVSNISRFGFQVASLNMFLAHPIFGVGFGQFGFHVVDYLPAWIFRSPEVGPMITFPNAPWPNVYSLYGRLAAELGLVGLCGWLLLWIGLAAKLAGRARAAARGAGVRVTAHYPVILNCVGVLVSGIATDTFRTPMIWVALGFGCSLLLRPYKAPANAVSAAPREALAQPRWQQ